MTDAGSFRKLSFKANCDLLSLCGSEDSCQNCEYLAFLNSKLHLKNKYNCGFGQKRECKNSSFFVFGHVCLLFQPK